MATGPYRDAGSKKHVLDLVCSPHFEQIINEMLDGTDIKLAVPDNRRPFGRANPDQWNEWKLENYLRAFPINQNPDALPSSWWIRHRGNRPNWDLICRITVAGQPGLLLVEAKAHKGEMSEQDKKGPPEDDSADGKRNDIQIRERIDETNRQLGTLGIGEFHLSADNHYQLANRIAYATKMAVSGIPTVLLYLGWLNSPKWPIDFIRNDADWLSVMRSYLKNVVPEGFPERTFFFGNGSLRMLIRSLPVPGDVPPIAAHAVSMPYAFPDVSAIPTQVKLECRQPTLENVGMPINLTVCEYQGTNVFVCRVGKKTTRIVNLNHEGEYFPESITVPTCDLMEIDVQPFFRRDTIQPVAGEVYKCDHPSKTDFVPPKSSIPAQPLFRVKVSNSGWETTRVWQVNDDDQEISDSFLVYNHHLLKN
jgi:hypothetical protein